MAQKDECKMTRAEFRRHKTEFIRAATDRRRAELKSVFASRQIVTLSSEEFEKMAAEKMEGTRQQVLAIQGAMPLGRAFAKAAALLGDAYKDSVCYALIPDLPGSRIMAYGVCPTAEVGDGIFDEAQLMGHETSTWRDARYEVSEERFRLSEGVPVLGGSGLEGILIKGAPSVRETVGTTVILMARQDFDTLYAQGMTPPQRVSPELWKDLCFFGQRENYQPQPGITFGEIFALPRPDLADGDGCHAALLATVHYMTALYGERYATKALCAK